MDEISRLRAEKLAEAHLSQLYLGHLSRDCNRPELALQAVNSRLIKIGARVIEHLRDHADILSRTVVRQQFSVTPEQARDFLRMTPMTFGLSDEQLAGVMFGTITVAMELLVCHTISNP